MATANGASKDVKNLDIVVIGAGMGGLACALSLAKQGFTRISVYETASNLGFVGAGIQLAPNLARILDRLGVWADIFKEAVEIRETSIREGADEHELAHVDLSDIEAKYGYPHSVGHRSSLAGQLFEGCKGEKAITFHFSTGAEEIKRWSSPPSFTAVPRNAEPYTVEADIILAADGIKSAVRTSMLKEINCDAQITDSKTAAYRIMLHRHQLEHDPELLELIDSNRVTRWIGEKRHIIAYPVSSKQIYNISSAQPDANFAEAPSVTYTTKGSKEAMLDVFHDFSPKVLRMLDLVPEGEVCEWRLRIHAPLPTWVHGEVALVGDACHPTLPHLNQGAAQAVEDAAVLGVCLAKLPSTKPEDIYKALRVYEKVRMDRAYLLVDMATQSGRALHLGEGTAKEERDKAFREAKERGGKLPDRWADADVQKMIFGTDIWKKAEDEFDELFGAVS
ncbi:FAD/NAD(P)-binding domain-containing protein [Rhizodiscina lignyota]|uniref:FAD/NAD(P)-binding domain-containing protein n=1 Tax=Rhizodiscina lignyota TaxID=1504668 RepID=A0A9P4I707_9PEZI|nr:FAD/NAD(P)-binding domain-containing protein [Rhizodiscina lignyota]